MTAQSPSSVSLIPLQQLKLSRTPAQRERRAHFDRAALAELAKSITSLGLQQPIIARPAVVESTPGLNGYRVLGEDFMSPDAAEEAARNTFEIVAGERRYLAAELAKLEAIPTLVRPLTDEQVLEVQLIENLQRSDVHPMAEAEGYEGLHKLGRSIEEIASRVGKSRAYVYARMKLLDLAPPARKAYYAGQLNASTALYVARVPKGLQEKAAKEIARGGWAGEPMSARRALEHLQREYMLRLAEAPFPTADATLVPAAGPCGACPKRTGNNPDLFGDVTGADVCTDPICYRQKVAAHVERSVAAARREGRTVLEGKAATAVAPQGTYSLKGYVKLTDKNYDDPKTRAWRQILGKAYAPTLLVHQPKDDGPELLEIAPIADLPKTPGRASRDLGADTYKARQRAEERKREAERAYRAALFTAIRAAAATRPALTTIDHQEIAIALFERLSHDQRRWFFRAMGWEASKKGGVMRYELPQDPAELDAAALPQLIRDLVLAPELMVFSYGQDKPEALENAAAYYHIDTKKIRAELAAVAKMDAKLKRKPAPAKRPGSSAKRPKTKRAS